jgi:hypothetical protein
MPKTEPHNLIPLSADTVTAPANQASTKVAKQLLQKWTSAYTAAGAGSPSVAPEVIGGQVATPASSKPANIWETEVIGGNFVTPASSKAAPSYPESYQRIFQQGERGALVESFVPLAEDEFNDLVARGSIVGNDGRQTRYFNTASQPGDGLIVADFVIQENRSGPPPIALDGDNRPLDNDPLRAELALDDSRMTVIIDRETGRGVINVSPSGMVIGPDGVTARPIVFDKNESHGNVPDNYFDISAAGDGIRIDYDAINSITAYGRAISVDGPIVLRRGDDGLFETSPASDADRYPAIVVTQYTPNGDRHVAYRDEGRGVIPGALPSREDVAEEVVEEVYETKRAWDFVSDLLSGRGLFSR